VNFRGRNGILAADSVAAALVFLFGSLWQFLHVPVARAADSHVPAFVGSETSG